MVASCEPLFHYLGIFLKVAWCNPSGQLNLYLLNLNLIGRFSENILFVSKLVIVQ